MMAQDKKNQRLHYCLAGALFLLIGMVINNNVKISGLYMDDLYLWSCFGETPLSTYLFPVGSQRFRFVFNFFAYLLLKITGANIHMIVPVNIFLNGCIAIWIFHMVNVISKSTGIAYLTGTMYMVSHFSYYQIGQLYGLLETLSLFGVLVILYCLYRYLNSSKIERVPFFIIANIAYFLTSFTHERYLVLLIPLLLVVLLRRVLVKSEPFDWRLLGSTMITFGIILLIRYLAIGSLAPAGTGGTNVTETFSVAGALRFSFDQVFYLLGVHAGPEYLNGIAWEQVPILMKCIVGGEIVTILALVFLFLIEVIRCKQTRIKNICNSVLFLSVIAMCIGASSVTIRLELRWVYVSFALALCYLAYLYRVVVKGKKNRLSALLLIVFYFACFLPVELFYRSYYPNIYFWENQQRYNSLAELTYGTYGTELFDKNIIIIGNRYKMDSFTAGTFFKPFNPGWKYPNPELTFVNDVNDFGLVTNSMLILAEDSKQNRYVDVTEFVREMKCQVKQGYYEDHWMDQAASLSITAGKEGRITLSGMFPGNAVGGETVTVLVNQEQEITVPLQGNMFDLVIETDAFQKTDLDISMNFYMKEALEQRGEYPLSALVEIKTQ